MKTSTIGLKSKARDELILATAKVVYLIAKGLNANLLMGRPPVMEIVDLGDSIKKFEEAVDTN